MDNNDNHIILSNGASALFVRIILLLFTIISFAAPIGATIGIFIIGIEFSLGILISYALFWGCGVYFLRAFLWKSFGKEIITFHDDKLTYNADYKYFKDGKEELDIEGLKIEMIYENNVDLNSGQLRIYNRTKEIETVSQLSLTDLERIKKKIKTRYNKVHIA